MQLLAGVRDALPAAACVVGNSSRHSTPQQQPQQQQRQAWQLCVAQVQRNLVQMVQLTKHWQHDNTLAAYMDTFLEYQTGCVAVEQGHRKGAGDTKRDTNMLLAALYKVC